MKKYTKSKEKVDQFAGPLIYSQVQIKILGEYPEL